MGPALRQQLRRRTGRGGRRPALGDRRWRAAVAAPRGSRRAETVLPAGHRRPQLRGPHPVKTRDLAYLALLGLPLAACSQSGLAPSTQMSGTNSSVVSGSLLFVTSTRSNELRVLDLEPRPGLQRDFVRAPNPLAPLSIPTVPAPVELATPTRYGPLGQPLQGDWVFARGAGSPSVSIVGAVNCPQQLREFGRITPRPDSVVTALTSRLSADDLRAHL